MGIFYSRIANDARGFFSTTKSIRHRYCQIFETIYWQAPCESGNSTQVMSISYSLKDITWVFFFVTTIKEGIKMEETITFWLDNKICSGFKISEIDNQTLVSYRDKYYIVVKGAALMKGIRPLYYSKTSMPLVWKKAMKGILPPPTAAFDQSEDEFLPVSTSTKKERTVMQKSPTTTLELSEDQPHASKPSAPAPKKSAAADIKPVKLVQASVTTTCPYCSHKQDLPFEKGKNGKPFFVACPRCNSEFAVRFVPVTMYQAQVAAFK